MKSKSKKIEWYAAGGGIAKYGPFRSQVAAWAAMRYAADMKAKTGLEHPENTRVWPEEA